MFSHTPTSFHQVIREPNIKPNTDTLKYKCLNPLSVWHNEHIWFHFIPLLDWYCKWSRIYFLFIAKHTIKEAINGEAEGNHEPKDCTNCCYFFQPVQLVWYGIYRTSKIIFRIRYQINCIYRLHVLMPNRFCFAVRTDSVSSKTEKIEKKCPPLHDMLLLDSTKY